MLAEWADTRQVNFNVEQYEMMCFGRKNEEMQYRIKDIVLKWDQEQRDQGVWVCMSLKVMV